MELKKAAKDLLALGDVSSERSSVDEFLFDVNDGKKFGFSTGFKSLDRYVGRIGPGQVWAIGGYTGTGKSYFVLNMISGMLLEPKEERPRICVFSTELSKQEYILRYIFMKTGIFPLKFYDYPKAYYDLAMENAKIFFSMNKSEDYNLKIYGGIYKLEEIAATLSAMKKAGTLPNIVFIDYVQDISVRDMVGEEDSMPIVIPTLKQFAMELGIAIVLVSQVNNYTQQKDFKQGKTPLSPFSNGKKLSHMMHTGIVLSRKRNDSLTSYHLQADVVKARAGTSGRIPFEILDGFGVIEIDKARAEQLDLAIENASTPKEVDKIIGRKDGPFNLGELLSTPSNKKGSPKEPGENDDTFGEISRYMGLN